MKFVLPTFELTPLPSIEDQLRAAGTDPGQALRYAEGDPAVLPCR